MQRLLRPVNDSNIYNPTPFGGGAIVGVDLPTGQQKMFEPDNPSVYDKDEIEWAQEQGAQTDEEIAEYITLHKRLEGK
uniref:Uncharacterized protein n=1 Tax=viral metagenome TaxID=1070528 RepID=A0A6M3L868_9ZZZZ